jgi:hypothetical protein
VGIAAEVPARVRPVRELAAGAPVRGRALSAGGDIDFFVVRENTEGEYTNLGGRLFEGTARELVIQESVFTRHGADRILRYGSGCRIPAGLLTGFKVDLKEVNAARRKRHARSVVILLLVVALAMAFAVALALIATLTLVLMVVVILIPILAHEIDWNAARVVLTAMLVPVLLMAWRDSQIDWLGTDRCALHPDGFCHDDRGRGSIADVDATVEAWLTNLYGHTNVRSLGGTDERRAGEQEKDTFHRRPRLDELLAWMAARNHCRALPTRRARMTSRAGRRWRIE